MKNYLLIFAAVLFVGLVIYEWRKKSTSAAGAIAAQAGQATNSNLTATSGEDQY